MTDDQGHGDLGVHGNPLIRTPRLDGLTAESVQLTQFYVCPVCSPTRASLMTGRYNYRTGAVDTYIGRAMMYGEEVTLAEMLAAAGYRTGIFGKWHLGDNYPLREIDQGFQESLVHRGGGIGQPADPPGNSYFDPVLFCNGEAVETTGYCTDLFTDAAIEFIEQHRDMPWFAYVAYNAPHSPLQVSDEYADPYRELGMTRDDFPDVGQPIGRRFDAEAVSRVYGMVTQIDDNVGRMLDALDELEIAENTIVIFLTDNGPGGQRYVSGMRGTKGTVYEGGIRVPCFVRWRAHLQGDREIDVPTAHIDVVPTLLAACGIDQPDDVHIDGLNLLPLLSGDSESLPERMLYFQWHRGDVPEKFRAFSARDSHYKIVQSRGVQPRGWSPSDAVFELFDIVADPYEMHDLAAEKPEIVERMRDAYSAWYDDVSSTRGYDPPRIMLGTPHENPVTLTRQDWRGPRAGWNADSLGYWEVHVATAGRYDVTLRIAAPGETAEATLHCAGADLTQPVAADAATIAFEGVTLAAGDARLEAEIRTGDGETGVLYVDVLSVDAPQAE